MNVLYVVDQKPDGYPGGIEYHVLDLIGGFVRKRKPVYILFPEKDSLCLRLYKDSTIEEYKYKGHRLDDHRLKDTDIEATFHKILDDVAVDIVHFQSIRTLPISLMELAKKRGKIVLTTLHEYYSWCINCIMLSPDFCWFEKNVEKCFECLTLSNYHVQRGYIAERRQYINYLFKIIDRVIVPSFYVKSVLLSLYEGLSTNRCLVIGNGIDKNLIMKNNRPRKIPSKGRLKLAFLGNFLHYKGNKTFLELIKYFQDSITIDFAIIGNIFDPALIPSYRNLNVIGGYSRKDVVEMVYKADPDFILLLSNWPETFSYTLSEAIASGTPVIATDNGALRERVSKEGVGYLVPMDSPISRILEIIEDVRHYPEVIDFLRKKVLDARKRLETVDDMIQNTFDLYQLL